MITWLREHQFALTEACARIGRQPLSLVLNVGVVAIALTLPLLGLTMIQSAGSVSTRLASDPEISVFLKTDLSQDASQALGPRLEALPHVRQLQFVPRDSALAELRTRPGIAQALQALDHNPLPNAYILHLDAPGQDAATLQEAMASQIQQLAGVDHVQIDSAWVRRLSALMRFARLALTLLAVALGAVVVAVIFNTIRLQVLTQREEIEVSQLVGATRRFVRRPFYYMGALQGALGGGLALALVAAALVPLNDAVGELARLYSVEFAFAELPWSHALVCVAICALLGWLAAVLSVGRHLHEGSVD